MALDQTATDTYDYEGNVVLSTVIVNWAADVQKGERYRMLSFGDAMFIC